MAIDLPTINGIAWDFTCLDFEANLNNLSLYLQDLTYETGLEPGEVRGARSKLITSTRGIQKDTGSFTLTQAAGRAFIQDLGPGYGLIYFNVSIELDDGKGNTASDQLLKCRIKKATPTPGKVNSVDVAVMKFDLFVSDVTLDGVSISDQNTAA